MSRLDEVQQRIGGYGHCRRMSDDRQPNKKSGSNAKYGQRERSGWKGSRRRSGIEMCGMSNVLSYRTQWYRIP